MKTWHIPLSTLIAGVLTVAGCSSSGDGEPAGTGGVPGTGGSPNTGGASSTGGASNTGGSANTGGRANTGGSTGGAATGGRAGGGSSATGGTATGGTAVGGRPAAGGSGGGGNPGSTGGMMGSTGGRAGSTGSGTCTASKSANTNVSGTGSHKVVVETNADNGIKEGTIFRPMDLGGTEKYPIFVWGEGGCSLDGLSNSAAMAEIASHGYFVVADGTPKGSGSRSLNSGDPVAMGKPLLAYVAWAIAENDKPCSAYYNAIDVTKVAANGFSCGGLMAEGTAGDARMTTWGFNSSGLMGANQNFYKTVHTPVLMVQGGPDDVAYANGKRDYEGIAALGQPILFFSKALGHGGDLFSKNGGDFTKIDLAWLNWQLKGDTGATGKGRLIGSGCPYCSDSAWEVMSKNVP